MVASYAILRKDAVLFIGQGFGLIVYIRNIMIYHGAENKEKQPFLDRIKAYRVGLLLGFTALVLFFNLNSWSVTESSEARYAEISKEMLDTGDWIHPQLMGIYHYHKPPMTYWITAVSYKIFGVTPFAARVFLQLSVLLQIFMVYKIGIFIFSNTRSAFMSAMLYASFPVVVIGGRALTTDSYLATFVLLALYFWFGYLNNSKKSFLIGSFISLGLGFLTKGPVVWIVPAILLAVYLFQKKKKPVISKTGFLGIFLMLVIGFSWFIWLYIEDSRFLDYFVFKHTIQRFATDTFSRSQPFWFYIAVLIVTAFPWFLILLGKTKEIFLAPKSRIAFLGAWVLIPVVFFSLSQSKLILYVLPVFGGLAFGGFAVWEALSAQAQKRWEQIQSGFQAIGLIGLVLSPLFDDRIILSYKFIFIWVILVSILAALQFSGIRRSDRMIVSAWIFTMGLTVMSTYFFTQNPGVTNDTRRVVEWIKENRPEDERIVIYNKRLPSVSFQTNRPIVSIYDGDESLNRETQFQKDNFWKKFLINLKTDPEWIQNPENQQGVWLAKVKKEMPELDNNFSWEILEEIDGWKIMKIKVENQ
jgi:4-amino-4-deoxy-L-arabinose transferase-like glycosyltransferase